MKKKIEKKDTHKTPPYNSKDDGNGSVIFFYVNDVNSPRDVWCCLCLPLVVFISSSRISAPTDKAMAHSCIEDVPCDDAFYREKKKQTTHSPESVTSFFFVHIINSHLHTNEVESNEKECCELCV
jgi:hypothetical protein